MTLQVGNYARIQLSKADLSDPDEFVYGVIDSFDFSGQVVHLELSEPLCGVPTASAMTYNVKQLTEAEYKLATCTSWKRSGDTMEFEFGDIRPKGSPLNMKCDHNWIPTGRSFLTDKMWYDCKICGEQKGG